MVHTSNAGHPGSISCQGTRSHMPQLRPSAAKKTSARLMEEESSEVGLHGKSYHFYLERQGMVCSVHTLELDNKEMGDGDSNGRAPED